MAVPIVAAAAPAVVGLVGRVAASRVFQWSVASVVGYFAVTRAAKAVATDASDTAGDVAEAVADGAARATRALLPIAAVAVGAYLLTRNNKG